MFNIFSKIKKLEINKNLQTINRIINDITNNFTCKLIDKRNIQIFVFYNNVHWIYRKR